MFLRWLCGVHQNGCWCIDDVFAYDFSSDFFIQQMTQHDRSPLSGGVLLGLGGTHGGQL